MGISQLWRLYTLEDFKTFLSEAGLEESLANAGINAEEFYQVLVEGTLQDVPDLSVIFPTDEEPYRPFRVNPPDSIPVPVYCRPLEIGGKKGDYNRDNHSDVVQIFSLTPDSELVWSINHLNLLSSFYVLGKRADIVLSGDFNGDERAQPATVSIQAALEASYLHWTVADGEEGTNEFIWGLSGDLVLTGDVDGDGKDDPIVVRRKGKYLYWYVKLANGEEIHKKLFGLAGDGVHSADVDGDGKDEIIVHRIISGGIYWMYQDITDDIENYHIVQFGLEGDSLPGLHDFDGDGSDDFTVTREVNGGIHTYYRSSISGQTVSYSFGLAGDVPLGGHFWGLTYEGSSVLRQENETVYLRNPINNATTELALSGDSYGLVRPDGKFILLGDSANVPEACDLTLDLQSSTGQFYWTPEAPETGTPEVRLPLSITSLYDISFIHYHKTTGEVLDSFSFLSAAADGSSRYIGNITADNLILDGGHGGYISVQLGDTTQCYSVGEPRFSLGYIDPSLNFVIVEESSSSTSSNSSTSSSGFNLTNSPDYFLSNFGFTLQTSSSTATSSSN